MSAPEFLVVGHVIKDVVAEGFRLGGTVVYAGLAAQRLGHRAAVTTSYGDDLDGTDLNVRRVLAGVDILRVPSPASSTMANIYLDGQREQRVYARAAPLAGDVIPEPWRETPLVLLGPLVDEFTPDLALAFPRSLVAATPQGWMRRWDETGLVRAKEWLPAVSVLERFAVLVLSEKDLPDGRAALDHYRRHVGIVAVTCDERGADIYHEGGAFHSPGFPRPEVDPTGAGDVFAAAFLVRYGETRDLPEAARWANCAASFVVEQEGVAGVPTRAQVEARLACTATP